jgi:DNA-binding CsgD family transcriptional regulator
MREIRNRLFAKAARLALKDLQAMHPETYRRLYEDHKAAVFADELQQPRRRVELVVKNPEAVDAIVALTHAGLSQAEISRRLGISDRTVARVRAALDVHPPEPFVDEMAVARAVDGDRSTRLNTPEMTEAVRRLIARGYSGSLVARRLGVSRRTVERHRARLKEAS